MTSVCEESFINKINQRELVGGISLDWSAEESHRHGVNKQNSKVRITKLSQPAGSEDLSAAV